MKARYATYLKIAVGLGLLVLILQRIEAPQEVLGLLRNLDIARFLAAATLLQGAVLLNALRWHVVLGRIGARPGLGMSVVGTVEGMFFNLFFPGGFGGDAMRIYRVYDNGAGAGDAIGAGLIDRALGLWGLSVMVLLAAPHVTAFDAMVSSRAIFLAAAVVVAGGLGAALAGRAIGVMSLPRWIAPAQVFLAQYGRVVISRAFVTRIFPILMMSNLAVCASMWFAAASVGLTTSFADAALVIEVAAFASAIPVTVGGWGVREGAIILLLEALGATNAAAVAAATVVGLTMVASGLVGAAVWMAVPYSGRRGIFRRKRADVIEEETTP